MHRFSAICSVQESRVASDHCTVVLGFSAKAGLNLALPLGSISAAPSNPLITKFKLGKAIWGSFLHFYPYIFGAVVDAGCWGAGATCKCFILVASFCLSSVPCFLCCCAL